MQKIVLITLFLSMILCLQAQGVNGGVNSGFTPSFNPNFDLGNSLISPDKLKMNHSMMFSSGMSSRGVGYYQSSYTNHLQFQLRPNLKFNLDLSVVNYGSMTHQNNLNFSGNNDNQNAFVPSFSLEYRPTEKSVVIFEYQQARGYQNPYNRRNDWWDR